MFSFMKKDKEKDKEKKEKKKKEKEEKHVEKREKREKKERQNITPEEMSRLEDVKRSVFHRLSDRDRSRKSQKTSEQGAVGKSESNESSISAASGTSLSSSSGTPSPSRELPPTGSSVSRSKSMPGQDNQRPQVLPKPRSILKAKTPAGASPVNREKLDDAKTLQDNTRLNEEMSGVTDAKQSHSTQLQSSASFAQQKLPPVEEFHAEKSFEGKDLPLPPLVAVKPPRKREVTVNRNASGGFGFSLRRGTLASNDGSGILQQVVFAEPGLGPNSHQTGLLPGDRLLEINGKNVESWSREEIVELIKTVGDSMLLKVQPIPELIELSVRPGKDGSSMDMQEDVVKGGTLKRSGSMRYRKPTLKRDSQENSWNVMMDGESHRRWENSSHHHLYSPGNSMESLTSIPEGRVTPSFTSMESLSSIPEGRVTPSSHFLHVYKRGGPNPRHQHATTPSRDPYDARPWHTNLRRQNSAPQLERPDKQQQQQLRSRHRVGSSDSAGHSRHGSSESVNSDSPGSRTSRCPACASHSYEDVDVFSTGGRTSPAVGLQKKRVVRRNSFESDMSHTHGSSPSTTADRRRSSLKQTLDKSNSFSGVEHVTPKSRSDRGSRNNSFCEADSVGGGVQGTNSGKERNTDRAVSSYSHANDRGEGGHHGKDFCLPGQHTARRLSNRGSATGSHQDALSHSAAKTRDRLSSSDNDLVTDNTHATSGRKSERLLPSTPNGIPGQNTARRRRERSGTDNGGGHTSPHYQTSEQHLSSSGSKSSGGKHQTKAAVVSRWKVSRRNSFGTPDQKSGARSVKQRCDDGGGVKSPVPVSIRPAYFDLDKALEEARRADGDCGKAKSEDEVETERQWLEAERMWLVHKGGFTGARLQPGGTTADGSVNIKLDSGELLSVDEDDVEKANPSTQDRADDLTVLRYLNESSALHVLRQRYAGNLPHTYAGPALLVINPMQHLPLYSEKLIQMFKGCKQEDIPPHVFSAAQIAYRDLLNTRRDQSLVFVGRSGSGKSTSAFHCLHYLLVAAGSVNNIFTVEKLTAISTLLQSFGNCRTALNTNASRFTHITTLDFDPSGVIASASVQVLMFEKSRVVRRPEGEPTFNIFYHLMAGLDAHLRSELHFQNLSEPNHFMGPLFKTEEEEEEDRQKAANNFARVQQAFQVIGASDEEVKAILYVLAAVYHLGVAGAAKGTHNKFQFSRPAAAQKAASLLGTTPEELARAIYYQGGSTSTLTRNASLRVTGGMDKGVYQTADTNTSVTDALEAFVLGLYSDAFNAVVSLINRSLSSSVRTLSSLVVVDSPGFQNPATCGRQTGANFEDLCCNYLHERLQLLYHESTLTAPQDRYAEENIDCDCDLVISSPAPLVSLMDQTPQQGLVRSSNTDLGNTDKKGLLWILDEEAMYPGATEDGFMERLFAQHGEQQVRKDSLLRKGSLGPTFILNHNQGTAPVQYNAAGWLRVCRDSPISKNSIVVLQDSKSPGISKLFGSLKGSVGGIVSGSIAGMEGSTSLRRVGSMRRTFMSGTAALKKKSICIQVKFQVDSVMEILRKTQSHFVFCFLPQQSAGLCEMREKTGAEDNQINVPLLRSQLRGFEILDALRLHRQGFPEFMQFREFVHKFQAMVPQSSRPSATTEERQAVNQVLDNLDVDKLNYRVGLSKVFFRPGVLSQLEAGRDDKLTGIVTQFQALCRSYLGRKKTEKLRVQHLAVRCLQRNVRKYMLIREWPWWKLYTKVKPILNVHRTEEELLEAQAELEAMKTKTEKLEKERNEYKAACEKLETRLADVTADLMEENTTSNQAGDMLEAESAERMRLEKELKDLQAKYSPLKRQNEKLQMEVMQARVWQAQSLEEELDDETDGGSSVYKERCERLMRELQMTKKQMQQQHEEDLEQELSSRKMVEKRLHEAVEEAEEQRRQVQVAKKKTQRLTAEMQDIKLHLEEQMARNNELERKQRRFDNELSMAHEDVREEKHMREKLQRERDQLLSEKYTLEQSIQNLRMDQQSAAEKADRLDKELNDILVSGKDNSEVVSLKRVKHELELKLREQEEELDDQAGQIQQLEQTKLRLEMNMEKMKKQHVSEVEEKEEELEDMRTKTQKKLRSMESQLEEEYEEKRRVMEEKANVERQLQEYSARAPSRDRESEKRLRRNLKKTKALLADAGTMLAKQKNVEGAKQQIAQLRNQLDDAEFSSGAAVKAKKRMELEIQDLNQQIEDMSRTKQEVENKNMMLLREKSDLQSQLEENEEEMSELMKKYKAAVQQHSVHQITMTDQLQQIQELVQDRDKLRQQVADLSARVQGYEESSVDKHSVTRLETKLRDYESRVELEQSQRQRFETQVTRLKEQVEKVSTEKEDVLANRAVTEESSKRAQKQLRELREELTDAQKKEMEASQKFKEREHEVEGLEMELAQSRADLKLAFRRITDLQAALEEELDSDDSLQLGDSDLDSEDDDEDDDLDSYLGNHHGAGHRLTSNYSHSNRVSVSATENGVTEA